MANGDLSNLAISANGMQASFDVEGLTAGSVTASAGDLLDIIFACTSEGYTGTTLGTKARSGIRCKFTGVSGTTVTVDLEESIHNDCTSVTMTAAAGAITDGTVSSASAVASAVANNSTLDYALPTCLFATPQWEKHTGEFYVNVYASVPFYAGHKANLGIAAVEVTATDNSGTGTAVAKTSTALTYYEDGNEFGSYTGLIVFRVGPFDVGTDGDWGAGGATDNAPLVLTAKAYPSIGDADSVRTSDTLYAMADPDNDLPMRHCVVSETGDNSTARIALGDGGYHAGTDSVDATAKANPFATLQRAARLMQAGDGTTSGAGTASYCVIYLEAGDFLLGPYSFSNAINTTLGPVIITRLPTVTRDLANIAGSDGVDGMRTNHIRLDGLGIRLGASGALRGGSAATSNSPLTGTDNWISFQNCVREGLGKAVLQATTPVNQFENTEAYNTEAKSLVAVGLGAKSVSCRFESIGDDTHNPRVNSLFLNNRYNDIDGNFDGNHVDIVQANGAVTNCVLSQAVITGLNKVQAPIFMRGNAMAITSLAYTFNICEADDNFTQPQIDGLDMDSWLFAGNVIREQLRVREQDGPLTMTNCRFEGNVFGGMTTFDTPELWPASWRNNHFMSEQTAVATFDETTGGTEANLFANYDSDDFRSAGALLTRVNERWAAFDASGQAVPETGSAIGALQPAAASSGTNYEPRNRTRTRSRNPITVTSGGGIVDQPAPEP